MKALVPARPWWTAATLGALALAGCGESGAKNTVDVTASDSTCQVAKTDLAAGKTTFRAKNTGSKVTEVYVYGPGDKKIGEVENIGPGSSRNLTVTLVPGSYEVACKPGMEGSGIRTTVKVS